MKNGELMFPKQGKKKKPIVRYTPMLNSCCFFTGRTDMLERHHLFGGPNRKLSEKYGLKVWLTHDWHNEPPNGVHHNETNMRILHEYGQQVFEESYPKLDFCKTFQLPNYLRMKEGE